jgi:hypothetical protein
VTVGEGTIYQKGFFSRVSPQLVVVNKYSNTGFTKSVGFYTAEDITDSNEDTSLLDNATGTYNYAAPGADRLKLTPELRVLDKQVADANTDFLPIMEFADGRPYKQNRGTVYNIIGDQIAQRTYEESGNYVLDTFTVTTHDSDTFSETPAVFKIDIDPGKAYINGHRVETGNYRANVAKGVATATNPAAKIRLGFGNFYRVKELGGNFAFNIGASVDIQSAAATYITSSAGTTITAPGTKIGEARIRSLTLESGQPGTANAVYRLYLFDITWLAGKNAGDARSIYYGGTNKGIADVVIGDAGRAVLEDAGVSSLLYNSVPAMKSVSNISYTYRTVNETETANTTGYIELNLGAGEFFPYSGALGDSGKKELLIVPKANYQASANAAGTISIGSGSTANVIVAGAGGTDFLNVFSAGDFVKFANSTGLNPVVRQISQVTGASSMILTAGPGQTYSGGSATLYFPANVPISLTNKAARYANVSVSNSQVMTIYLANNIANSTGDATSANVMVVYNATRNNISSSVKTANRSVYTRIVCSNNSGLLTGPWALGLSDAFRMRKVYQANGVSRAQAFNANTGMTGSGTGNAFILMGSNKFANGDSVVYSNTGMTTGITGLTNGGTYYAVYANSTGMALASTRGGANLTLTATATSESHTLTGEAIFFTGNTSGVSDITNDFYIDTNQKEDYLDTSYLYRKPGKPALAANTVLLVQYDVFTGGDASVKTISSYAIDDSLGFDALSAQANVHTVEIPEILGVGNRYYDLRDQYDFRPRSANTINLITDISSVAAGTNALSIINPTEPSSSARFTASEKYFPAPDTDLTANIEFYLGRTDRVVVDNNGEFVVRAGKNGNADYIPPEPKNSLTLQLINIPAYPSLPEARSADMMKIIDTKVANEVYGKRIKKYTVTNLISATDRSRIQVKGYKMADIASLEKRIKDLEYYVGLTLAEALTRSRFIPSSADSLTDRFRFGFFVDPFTDYNYSDIGNPEFYATIGDNHLSPKLTELNIEFKPEDNSTGIITLPFNEFTIISQNDATNGAVVVTGTGTGTGTGTSTGTGTGTSTGTGTGTGTGTDTGTGTGTDTGTGTVTDTSGNITTTVVTQSTAIVLQSQRSTSRNDNGSVYEEFLYTFSSLSGPVEFYINSRDNNIALEVFQSTVQGGEYVTTYTSASALPITTADIIAKGLSLNDGRPVEHPGEFRRKSYGPVGGFLEDQFKLLWTHNPNDGIYYKIRVYKGSNHGGQGSSGTYGFKLYYPSDSVSTQTTTVSNVANFNYTGIVNNVTPPEFTISLSTQYIDIGYGVGQLLYIADAQKFVINVTGLKPNTYHKFMFAGQDRTDKCSQSRSSTTNTSGLLTDENGTMSFDFYYDAGIDEATSDLEQQNKLASATAGIKVFSIESYDNNSKATGSISLKYYTDLVLTNSGGLNVSATVTDSAVAGAGSTSDNFATAGFDVGFTTQEINNAQERNNVRYVFNEEYNVQLD